MTEPLNEKATPLASDAEVAGLGPQFRSTMSGGLEVMDGGIWTHVPRQAQQALSAVTLDHAVRTSSVIVAFGQALSCSDAVKEAFDRAGAELTAARAEIEKLSSALLRIELAHTPSQPPSSGCDEATWVMRHVAYIRGIARDALSATKKD